MRELARLPLGDRHALVVLEDDGDVRPLPWLVDQDRAAEPGEGAAEALLRLLAAGSSSHAGFDVVGWESTAVEGERTFGVDQTNSSIVVGERAVVKWMRAAEPGPHPAPAVLAALRGAGFAGMPRPWGLVQWRGAHDEAPRLLVTVDTLLPGAVDGWTWAVADVRDAALSDSTSAVVARGAQVGGLVADLHAALSGTSRPARPEEVRAWHADALADLDRALAATTGEPHRLLVEREDALRRLLAGEHGPAPQVQQVHGDLHVGQLLLAGRTLVITDFDGNPVVPPGERTRPQPVALDVAGMAQSLCHAAYVLQRHEPEHHADRVQRARDALVSTFLQAHEERLRELGLDHLLEPGLVPALRLRQVCREFSYAALHLPRWSYVPQAAIQDLVPHQESS